jgi:peptidoglycan/xylan/chitin deacetylase (PgdA/CDA1 family)
MKSWIQTHTRMLCRSAFAFLALASAPCRAENVAVTFDDLPTYGVRGDIEDAQSVTTRLLTGLKQHHIKATGFVNEIQLAGNDREQRIALLSQWLEAGMELGNHSYSHLSLSKTPIDAYIADVAHGEEVTRPLMTKRGLQERWYRHPYLETGTTAEARKQFETWLADHGYRVAPVTMENSDWQFADQYDKALAARDERRAVEIRNEYLTFSASMIAWYRAAGLQLLGRRPAFVLLLHASRLNAASIDDLADILQAQDLHPVSLEKATADTAYRTADTYLGTDGVGWLTRWSLTLHKALPWSSLPHVPADIAAPTL